MVLLEARILGLPIIVSDFATVADSCYPDGQLVIGMEVEDIYRGLLSFAEGHVPNEFCFKPVEYDEACMKLFYEYADGGAANDN